jgi:hypothetical protein
VTEDREKSGRFVGVACLQFFGSPGRKPFECCKVGHK